MKKIKKEVVFFVAEDGKEFTTAIACELYEKELRAERLAAKKLADEVKKIERADINMPPMGYGYADIDRYTYSWFKPKSEQEISALNDYFKLENNISSDFIGKWIGVEFEGGPDIEDFEGDAYFLEFDISIKSTIEFYEALGYCVEISKVDTGNAIASNKGEDGVG